MAPSVKVRKSQHPKSQVVTTVLQGEVLEGHKDVIQFADRTVCLRVRYEHNHEEIGYITADDTPIGGRIHAELMETPSLDHQASAPCQGT